MTLAKKRRILNNALAKIKNTTLSDWLKEASSISNEISNALEGIYCGREGRIHVQLPGEFNKLYITMGWYSISNHPKVEYAYVS